MPRDSDKILLHGLFKQEQHILVVWYNQEGVVYVDVLLVGLQFSMGETLEISSDSSTL